MTKIKKALNAVILCAGLLFTALSCSHPEDAKDTLVHACTANLYEIRASENATLNAATPEVKRLAAMLVQAHTEMNEDVKKLAAGKDITLPIDLNDEQREHLEKLTEKTGIDYDRTFTEQMKEKHEHALEFYQKTAVKCQDPDLKAWAESSANEVRAHMDMVLSAYNLVKANK